MNKMVPGKLVGHGFTPPKKMLKNAHQKTSREKQSFNSPFKNPKPKRKKMNMHAAYHICGALIKLLCHWKLSLWIKEGMNVTHANVNMNPKDTEIKINRCIFINANANTNTNKYKCKVSVNKHLSLSIILKLKHACTTVSKKMSCWNFTGEKKSESNEDTKKVCSFEGVAWGFQMTFLWVCACVRACVSVL